MKEKKKVFKSVIEYEQEYFLKALVEVNLEYRRYGEYDTFSETLD